MNSNYISIENLSSIICPHCGTLNHVDFWLSHNPNGAWIYCFKCGQEIAI